MRVAAIYMTSYSAVGLITWDTVVQILDGVYIWKALTGGGNMQPCVLNLTQVKPLYHYMKYLQSFQV